MTKQLALAPYTLKHCETEADAYFFYNTKSGNLWKTDATTGSIIATLDGTLSSEGIVEMLHKNNQDTAKSELEEHFCKTFEFLLKEGYIYESN